MQSTSCKMPGWMKHKLETSLPGEISITTDMQMIASLWQKVKNNKGASWLGERGEWKRWLKTQHSKTTIMASGPIISWQIDRETMETVIHFIFLCSKIILNGDCSHEIKRCLLLKREAMTNLDSILKSRDITLPAKVCLFKAMVFPVVMYGCESWI